MRMNGEAIIGILTQAETHFMADKPTVREFVEIRQFDIFIGVDEVRVVGGRS
jgi:hypothetical protein